MAEMRKQHIVPRFYLKAWSNGKGFTNLLLPRTRRVRTGIPYHNQCYGKYRFGKDLAIEKSLQWYDDEAARLLQDIKHQDRIPKKGSNRHAFLSQWVAL